MRIASHHSTTAYVIHLIAFQLLLLINIITTHDKQGKSTKAGQYDNRGVSAKFCEQPKLSRDFF
jgi:hypothetical protein